MMTDANRAVAGSNERGDLVGQSDARTTWQTIARENVASWRECGLDGDRTYVYGAFPATVGVVINLGEVLVHNWDLATATGQPCALDPELSATVFGLYSAMPLEQLRADGVFGPEIPVPEDAPIADRLLGLLGRRPSIVQCATAPTIARAGESETLRLGSGTLQLLLDASVTGGALERTPSAPLRRAVGCQRGRAHQRQRALLRTGREHRRVGGRPRADRDCRRPRRGAPRPPPRVRGLRPRGAPTCS